MGKSWNNYRGKQIRGTFVTIKKPNPKEICVTFVTKKKVKMLSSARLLLRSSPSMKYGHQETQGVRH